MPRVRRIQRRFERWRAREAGSASGPFDSTELLSLLRTTEDDLLAALRAPELAPMRAWVEDFFDEQREALPAWTLVEKEAPPGRRSTSGATVLRAARLDHVDRLPGGRILPAQDVGTDERVRDQQEDVLDRIAAFLSRLLERTEAGELTTDLCVRSRPAPGVVVRLFAPRYRQRTLVTETEDALNVAYRGLYAWEVEPAGSGDPFGCTEGACGLLDLWKNDGPFVVCNVATEVCRLDEGDLTTCGAP